MNGAEMKHYEYLANAIIIQAVLDYKAVCKLLRKHPDDIMAQSEAKKIKIFFHSRWFRTLTSIDAEYLIRQIEAEVEAGTNEKRGYKSKGFCMAMETIKDETKGNRNMTINEYQELAMRTSNQKLSTMEHIINGALGLAGESGEVADLVKKWTMQGHIIDAKHLMKELGDVCWYIAETATAIGCTMEEIMQMNIDKLRERYPDGFDPEKSQHRAAGDV